MLDDKPLLSELLMADRLLLAAPLLLVGLMLEMGWSLDLFKILMIMILVLATNPTATHAMAKAALHGGHPPKLGDASDEAQGDASSKA